MRSIKLPTAPPRIKPSASICANNVGAKRIIHTIKPMLTSVLNPEKNQICQLPDSAKKLNAEPELKASVQENIGNTATDSYGIKCVIAQYFVS